MPNVRFVWLGGFAAHEAKPGHDYRPRLERGIQAAGDASLLLKLKQPGRKNLPSSAYRR